MLTSLGTTYWGTLRCFLVGTRSLAPDILRNWLKFKFKVQFTKALDALDILHNQIFGSIPTQIIDAVNLATIELFLQHAMRWNPDEVEVENWRSSLRRKPSIRIGDRASEEILVEIDGVEVRRDGGREPERRLKDKTKYLRFLRLERKPRTGPEMLVLLTTSYARRGSWEIWEGMWPTWLGSLWSLRCFRLGREWWELCH